MSVGGTESNFVRVERFGGRAEVVLNRPQRRNALTAPLVSGLRDALEQLAQDDSVTVILLRGAEGCFCSGFDVAEFDDDSAAEADFPEVWSRLHIAAFDCEKPIVGALERFAIAGGSGLALACDLLVVGHNSYLHIAEPQLGMAAPISVAWLQMKVGLARAYEMALTAERYSGPALVRLGLAVRAVPDDDVLSEARALADRLCCYPVEAHAATKRVARALAPFGSARCYFGEAVRASSESKSLRTGPKPVRLPTASA